MAYRFRWVFCQLETLENCFAYEEVQKALSSLPDTLDETYRRILTNIPERQLNKAKRLLQFLCVLWSVLCASMKQWIFLLWIACKDHGSRSKTECLDPRRS